MKPKKILLAISGSSGTIYAKRILDKLLSLQDQFEQCAFVMSENAKLNWQLEIGEQSYENYPFKLYSNRDFMAPFASGSAKFDTMLLCPASMGMIGRIASGVSDDLISRSADVILKERRKLIVVPRETPYSLIHLNNLIKLTEAGAIICPACPSFYSLPKTIQDLVDTVSDRILDLAGFEIEAFRWGESTI